MKRKLQKKQGKRENEVNKKGSQTKRDKMQDTSEKENPENLPFDDSSEHLDEV